MRSPPGILAVFDYLLGSTPVHQKNGANSRLDKLCVMDQHNHSWDTSAQPGSKGQHARHRFLEMCYISIMEEVSQRNQRCYRTAFDTKDLMNIRRHFNDWWEVEQVAVNTQIFEDSKEYTVVWDVGLHSRLTGGPTRYSWQSYLPIQVLVGVGGKEEKMGQRWRRSLHCQCLT